MANPSGRQTSLLLRYFPILAWLPAYRREWLGGDLVAGLTAWALTIPLAMAFADVAGVPVQYGLYAACLAPIAYAIFGTSRHLNVGPTATISAISAATVMPLANVGTQRYLTLIVALALITGAILILGGITRVGFISKFLARPVLHGYIVGTAIFIAIGQLDKIFGVTAEGGNTFARFADILRQAGSWSWVTIAAGAACLLALFVLRKAVPRVPAALAVMVLAILAASLFDLGAHGAELVGEIPRGVNGLSLSGIGVNDIVKLLPGALVLALFAFTESLAFAKVYAARHGYHVDANQEMVSLGAANVGAGILGGFAVDASFTRSAVAEQAGGRTQLASLICSALTFATLFLFTGFFKYLPQAALAAIVVFAVARLIEFRPFVRLRRSSRADFALSLGAFFGVLIFGVVIGILIGIVLSLAGFVVRTSRPHSAVLGVDESGSRHGDLAERPDCKAYSPYLVIYRFDAPLIFTNVDKLVDDILHMVEEADARPRAVIVDCEMIYEMDTTASDELAGLHARLSETGIDLMLARVHAPVRAFMRRDGLTEIIGENNMFHTVRDAVRAFQKLHPEHC